MITRRPVKQETSARELFPAPYGWDTDTIVLMRNRAARLMYGDSAIDVALGCVQVALCEEVLNERGIV